MKKVLLHICCAVCSTVPIQRLRQEGYYVEGFFFNPNIHPLREYKKRKEALSIIEKEFDIKIHEGDYNPKEWFSLCRDYAHCKEGGKRCVLCFQYRLKKTYEFLLYLKFDYFTTTLTISPHKKSEIIFKIGKDLADDRFLAIDFKKKDGFKLAIEFSKKYRIYRQNYCGCVYSYMERCRKDSTPSIAI